MDQKHGGKGRPVIPRIWKLDTISLPNASTFLLAFRNLLAQGVPGTSGNKARPSYNKPLGRSVKPIKFNTGRASTTGILASKQLAPCPRCSEHSLIQDVRMYSSEAKTDLA